MVKIIDEIIERSYIEEEVVDVYITVQGDTWDIIALKVYGSEKHMSKIMLANAQLANIIYFSANVKVICPDIEIQTSGNIPPWKR